MRAPILFLAIAFALLPAFASAGQGDPRGDPCQGPKGGPCTGVEAGTMTCFPTQGQANALSQVVGSQNSGTFELHANGTNKLLAGPACQFEIRVRPADATFDETFAPGLLGTPGQITSSTSTPCLALPGATCETKASFTWWRAVHGVSFDVPFDLLVDGIVVASGHCHYFDPPAMEKVTGGPVVLAH